MIRLAVPDIDDADIAAVTAVLRSGYLVQGERVRDFERRVAARVGARHAIAVSNCTAALHLSLLALDIGSGDRVAVTTYSWPATANVIALCGAEPVFVDVDRRTFNMDPERLDAALRGGPRAKAVMPVHTFGGMADMPRIIEIAERHGLPVIEDAACALGAEIEGRPAGSWGAVGCFSFHPRKAVTTGEGGIAATNDDRLARTIRSLRNHGLDPEAAGPDFVMPGFNLRLTDFQGALGVTQVEKLDRMIERRRALAAAYDTLFEGTEIVAPAALPRSRHVYQSYVALIPPERAPQRPEVIAALRDAGIEAAIGTHHLPLTRYFRCRGGFTAGRFPATDDVAARALALPLHSRLSETEQRYVAATLLALVSPRVARAGGERAG